MKGSGYSEPDRYKTYSTMISLVQKTMIIGLSLMLICCQGSRSTDVLNEADAPRKDSLPKSESLRKEVREDLDVYLLAQQNKDYEGMMEKTYQEIFDRVPRDSVIKNLQQPKEFRDENFSYELKGVSPRIKDNGKDVVVVKYTFDKEISLTQKDTIDPEVMEQLFRERYGRNVDYDEESRTFHVRGKEVIYGIKKDGEDEWKFMTFEQSQDPVNRKLLSLETYKKMIDYE